VRHCNHWRTRINRINWAHGVAILTMRRRWAPVQRLIRWNIVEAIVHASLRRPGHCAHWCPWHERHNIFHRIDSCKWRTTLIPVACVPPRCPDSSSPVILDGTPSRLLISMPHQESPSGPKWFFSRDVPGICAHNIIDNYIGKISY
jgi:hypothetical protein